GGIMAALLLRRSTLSNLRNGLSGNIRRRPIEKTATRDCISCGRTIPMEAAFCDWCGSPQAAPSMAGELTPPQPQALPEGTSGVGGYVYASELDQRVLSYIAEHGGEISLSRATVDLGVSQEELLAAIERLRKSGRLEPA
ncbi:MAG: hypothetical protein QXE79_08205, partial [Candidatus Bathyarchaeia archaeon]